MSRFNRQIHGGNADIYFVSVVPVMHLYPGVAWQFPDGPSRTGRDHLRKTLRGKEWWWR